MLVLSFFLDARLICSQVIKYFACFALTPVKFIRHFHCSQITSARFFSQDSLVNTRLENATDLIGGYKKAIGIRNSDLWLISLKVKGDGVFE